MTSTQLHPAVQRARCWTALSLFGPYAHPDVWEPQYRDRITKLSRWYKDALSGLGDRKVSAKAMHCMDDMMAVLSDNLSLHTRRDIKIVRPEDLMKTFVAVAHLIIDVRITCKEWASGRAWCFLDAMTFSLLRELVRRYPEAEEPGFSMYEDFCNVWDKYVKKIA